MTADNVTTLVPRMTPSQFDSELAKLRRTYGDNRREAGARWEQELAKLFARSGWKQEELGRRVGKSRQYVGQLLVFGQFLNNAAMAAIGETPFSDLTERRFRSYWSRTEGGNHRVRFAEVVRLMREHPDGFGLVRGAGATIRAEFADGKWHDFRTLAERIGASDEALRKTLDNLCSQRVGNYGLRTERKAVGTSWRYRFFRKENAIGAMELSEKLTPLIKALKAEGRKNAATASPPTVAHLAHCLERLLEEWNAASGANGEDQ